MPTTPSTILALDVGDKRVGVARASRVARLPEPLTTLERSDHFFEELQQLVVTEGADTLVVGLPRGLEGQTTEQTRATKTFVTELRQRVDLPVHTQDEAVTSQRAKKELTASGKPYQRGDIDALAATYILEDFLAADPGKVNA